MQLYGNPNITGVERRFGADEIIVSKTDLTGKLTYGNRTFFKLAGMDEKRCIGQQHNIIRHPEMPRCVFKLAWNTLKDGKEFFGYVNNRSANGDNYWVFAHMTPSFDGSHNIIGYHSNRRVANRQILDSSIIPLYKDLLATEKASSSPKEGLEAGYNKIINLLKEKNMSFNQFIFSLGA